MIHTSFWDSTAGAAPMTDLQILELCVPFSSKCWSRGHRCFVGRREQILKCAEQALGNRDLAERWLIKPSAGLDHRSPCSLLADHLGYGHVRDDLVRLDYGVYQ
ncbi:antitoxin Xre/MbcA/ParS toxin-binding domain-containing protein [Pseudomonas vranovensis]|uniref:antitoxin Xre/MbcA/ParS toxin-binding domain-containing protein n=1 Tax=Pseudomonas vranovensis TaxID=321661 RepID=UPI003D955547